MRRFADSLGRHLPVDTQRPVQTTAAAVGFGLWVLYALMGYLPHSGVVTALRVVAYLGVYLACLAAMAAEFRVSQRSMRLVWGAGVMSMVIAILGTVYFETVVRSLPVRPYPALSDYGRFLIDGLIYLAITGQIRTRVRIWHPSIRLDGTVVAATVVAVGLQFWTVPLMRVNAGNRGATATAFLYIMGDLALMGMVIGGLAMLNWRSDRQWMVIGLSLIVLCGGDAVLFTQEALNPQATHRILIDLGMMGAANGMTWATALPESMRTRLRDESRYSGVLIAPGVCTLIALVLTTPVGGWHPSAMTQLAAAVVLLCAGLRAALSYREIRALAAARSEVRTDALTGLLNRRGFEDEMAERLATLRPDGGLIPGRLLLLDISRFKEINDSLGHQSGDALLTQFAQRVRELSPDEYTVARLGGNEFAVYRTDPETVPGEGGGDADCSAQVAALTELPYEVDGIALHLALGASVARFPEHGEDFAALIRAADLAMTHSKTEHDIVVFDPVMAQGFEQSRVIAASELRHALEHDEIVVYYQPKVRLADSLPYGVEALVRWQHPTDGLIFPDTFLPLVEQAGLMPRLTDVVMRRAINDVAQWRREGLHLSVSVNVPAAAIMDSNLPLRVAELLERAEVPSEFLTVEITEQALLGDRVRCQEVLAALRQNGVAVSIDDYGTGYSSLAYLRELPVDELKLDKSFIFPMATDPRAAAIVRSTIDLAHSLGLFIVAEGVEDDRTMQQLTSYDCDTGQGYYFSRPVPAAALLEWFQARTVERVPVPR